MRWRAVLIVVLTVALATTTWADDPRLAENPTSNSGFQKLGNEVLIGIVVAAVVVAVVVVVLVRHHKRQRITGCVRAGANGMSMTDEKDKRDYTLSGEAAGVKAGDRMALEGKRKDTSTALVFEAHKVARDFGACQP